MHDEWAAYQFDNAVAFFGTVIENAAQELHNVGDKEKPDWKPKYAMGQLLTPGHRLETEEKANADPVILKGIHGIKFDEVK